jgi:hypothetical protein
MNALLQFFLTHHEVLLAWVFWPALSAVISLAFRKRTPAQWHAWAQQRPKLAYLVEFAKTNGLDISKNLLLLQRLAQRRAGKLPDEVWAALPVSPAVKRVLQDEKLRGDLMSLIESKTDEKGEVKLLD